MDKNCIVKYTVFEADEPLISGEIPLHLVQAGRGGDSSLEGMWLAEWGPDVEDYPGNYRRIEVYFDDFTFVIRDDAPFHRQEEDYK